MSTQNNKKKRTKKKSSHATVAQRVEMIYKLKMKGYSRQKIVQYVSNKTDWNVTSRTVDNYISRASAAILERSEIVKDREFSTAVEQYRFLYSKAVQAKRWGTARMILNDLVKLLKLNNYEPTEKQATSEEIIAFLSSKGLIDQEN
jgi:hypothetical protein